MRDYWLTQSILGAVGWAYIIFSAVAIPASFILPKLMREKITIGLIVSGLLSIFPIQAYQEYREQAKAAEEFKQRLAKARALFESRCRNAGEKVYKTAGDVSGVFLMNLRPKFADRWNQFDENDPAGDSATGDGYIQTFLMGRNKEQAYPFSLSYATNEGAYQFVETPSSDDLHVMRYTDNRSPIDREKKSPMKLAREIEMHRAAQFGIKWEDISSSDDRAYWIAGSRIEVVNLSTREVLAERIGYILDMGQGDKSGGRQPWTFAKYFSCPELPKLHGRYPHDWGLTRNFVEQVLKPKNFGANK